jgi:hypothetical protein
MPQTIVINERCAARCAISGDLDGWDYQCPACGFGSVPSPPADERQRRGIEYAQAAHAVAAELSRLADEISAVAITPPGASGGGIDFLRAVADIEGIIAKAAEMPAIARLRAAGEHASQAGAGS